jgi:Sec-independent protein translocase protein TatA
MKIFNVGALEFVFILLLAFLILGPKKAIVTAGDVGRWIKKVINSQFWRDLVTTSKQIQDLPQKMMDEAEIQNTIMDLERTSNQVSGVMKEMETKVKRESEEIENTIRSPHHIHPDPKETQSEE